MEDYDSIEFVNPNSAFGRRFPTSYLAQRGATKYRIEMESVEALYAMSILAVHQQQHDRGISEAELIEKARELDEQADLERRISNNPIAHILLNFDSYWARWQQGIGMEKFEYHELRPI